MSDTDIQESIVTETAPSVIPVSDQPSEEGAPIVATVPTPAEAAAQQADENPSVPVAPAAPAGPVVRAAPTNLEGDLRKVLDDYVSGVFKLPEGSLATPHTLAAEIAKRRGDGKAVSSGAVSDALRRWVEVGFATLSSKPTAFVDYTDAARSQGLHALKAAHRLSRSAARKAVAEPATAVPLATGSTLPVPPTPPVQQEAPVVEAWPAVEESIPFVPVVSVPVAPEAYDSPVEATSPTAPPEPTSFSESPSQVVDTSPATVNENPVSSVEIISDTGIRQDPITSGDVVPF